MRLSIVSLRMDYRRSVLSLGSDYPRFLLYTCSDYRVSVVLIIFWTFCFIQLGSQAFVTSLFGPFFRFVNFWFFLIVLWLPSSIVSPQLYFIAFQDFGSLLQSCFWSFITSTMWFLCLLSPSFVLQSWVCCLSLVAFSTFCQRSKQSVLLLLLFAGSFLQLYRPLKVTCLCSTSLSFVVSSFAVWYIQLIDCLAS